MEISKLLEELQRLNECLDACDVPCDCEELQIEKPIEFETQDIPQTEIKEPELAEEDVKDTVASKLLKQLADMNLEKEEPVEAPVEKKNETIDTEAVFDLDDKIANVENELLKIRQEIDKNPENTELVQKRDKLNNVLKRLKTKRDKKMDESSNKEYFPLDEVSQQVYDLEDADELGLFIINDGDIYRQYSSKAQKDAKEGKDVDWDKITAIGARKYYKEIDKTPFTPEELKNTAEYIKDYYINESKINEISDKLANTVAGFRKANAYDAEQKFRALDDEHTAELTKIDNNYTNRDIMLGKADKDIDAVNAKYEPLENEQRKIIKKAEKNADLMAKRNARKNESKINEISDKLASKVVSKRMAQYKKEGDELDKQAADVVNVQNSLNPNVREIEKEYANNLDNFFGGIKQKAHKLYRTINKRAQRLDKENEYGQYFDSLRKNESKINEISQELADKVITQRKANMDNAVNKYANSLALQRKRRQAPVQIEEPKTALNIAQAPEEEIEDDKILSTPLKNRLQKILDLGFIDVTGPKQKEKHIIMLQGLYSGRGYRIDNSGETCIASALNNFGPISDGAYRYGKDMFRGDLADCLVWVYENAKKHLDRMFKNKNESKINEVSQETVDAVKAEREKDVVKKTKEYKQTGKEEDREIAKEAKDKLNKFNKLEKDWKKSKKIKESKDTKTVLVAKFKEGNNTHQIIKNDGKYMIRYNVNEDKALSSYGPIDSLSVAIEALMKRCPKAEQVK